MFQHHFATYRVGLLVSYYVECGRCLSPCWMCWTHLTTGYQGIETVHCDVWGEWEGSRWKEEEGGGEGERLWGHQKVQGETKGWGGGEKRRIEELRRENEEIEMRNRTKEQVRGKGQREEMVKESKEDKHVRKRNKEMLAKMWRKDITK